MSPFSQTNTLLGLLHMKTEAAPSSNIMIRIFHAGADEKLMSSGIPCHDDHLTREVEAQWSSKKFVTI
jgi:hypothetical protein